MTRNLLSVRVLTVTRTYLLQEGLEENAGDDQ